MFRHLFPTAPDTLGMHVFSFIVSPWSRIDVFMVSCTLARLIDVKLINFSVTDMHYMLLFIHNLCCYLPYIYIYISSLVGCFPFYDQDPFIIKTVPHVYFAGNQPEFASSTVTGAYPFLRMTE